MLDRAFPNLFSSLKLRHKTLKNRITFGAHTANMAEQGLPGPRHLGYYLERARGGAGMIVVEPMPIHRTGVLTRGNFRPDSDAVIPGFRDITDACHEYGTVMIHQLYHVGQHGDAMNSYAPNWSPSGLPSYHDHDGGHAMTEDEIETILRAFVEAARRAKDAGFDGIELFAAYHALIDQFWTPWSNRRDDRWGGSFENRMRFSTELTRRIRIMAGQDFIIGVATSIDPDQDSALSVENLAEIAAYHDERGLVDYITVGTGSYFDFTGIIPSTFHPKMWGPRYARHLKSSVTRTVIQAESHISTPENAEKVIAGGEADLCSLVRAQIADPHLASKARTGRSAEIRPCISCNQMCWGRRDKDYWISCLVNPSAGREFEWGGDRFMLAPRPKKIVVVGGGPGGMETARVAAERGHRVTLIERGADLGGQWLIAGSQPTRDRILEHIAWLGRELRRLGVDLRFGEAATMDSIKAMAPDCVVVATGGKPSKTGFQKSLPDQDSLPGAGAPNVHSFHAAISGEAELGRRVLILDELNDWRGTGTGLMLAQKGHEVTVLTAAPFLASELHYTATDIPLRQQFAQAGGTAIVEAALLSWSVAGDEGSMAEIVSLLDGSDSTAHFDDLVLSILPDREDDLLLELQGDKSNDFAVHAVGDCVAPRRAIMAIYEGRALAQSL